MLSLLKPSQGKATEDFSMPKTAKRVIVRVAKGIGAVAVLVLFFAPVTDDYIFVMVGSISVALACLLVICTLGGDEFSGYWPDKPEQ
jgi:ABC-type Fe3+-siderophore transport system permease subunit